MTGIAHTLNIAVGALAAQQYGLSVAGHNVANVNTESYSRQRLSLMANQPVQYAGILFGSGVDTESVQRISNQVLEDRLAQERSTLAAYEGAETYINVIEGYFDETGENSVSSLMSDFWNSWHDLSNNPSGAADRSIVYENGLLVTKRFQTMGSDLDTLETDLTREIEALISEVNGITAEIAEINQEIVKFDVTGSANDQRDRRNALVSELSDLIDIYSFEQGDGMLNITAANGYPIVNGSDAYRLEVAQGQVMWENSYGQLNDITGHISGGRIGGLLTIRDEVCQMARAELDVLANEFIWSVNQVHSQGIGLEYFAEPVDGTYATASSGLLSTLAYGDKIDYTKNFKMWVEDNSTLTPSYVPVVMDMGISQAGITGWSGAASAQTELKYVFTVKDAGDIGLDGNVVVTDGTGLGMVQAGTDAGAALDAAMAAQRIVVYGGTQGSQSITVADGGDAERSAASIAAALSGLDGVSASAFENTLVLDISTLLDPAVTSAHENDRVSFSLSSAGRTEAVSFQIGAYEHETRTNFQEALNSAVSTVNAYGNDLTLNYDGNAVTIVSATGENIGISDFDVEDLAVATLDNFQNLGVATAVGVDNFTNFANGETVDVVISTAQGSVNVSYVITDDTDQVTLATDFETALTNSAAALTSIGVSFARVAGTVTITGDASAGYVDLLAATPGAGGDESFDIIPAAGSGQYPAGGDNTLVFDGTGDLEQYAGTNFVSFTVNGTDSILVDLRRVDTTSAFEVAQAFYAGLDTSVTNAYVTHLGTSVTITATDESASDFSFAGGTETSGADGFFAITVPGAALPDTDTFTLDGVDTASFTSVGQTDTITVDGVTLTESGGAPGTFDSAVKAGTLTVVMDTGLSIQSNAAGTAGSVFNIGADTSVPLATAVLTLGGDGAFSGFDPGNQIGFRVDNTYVSYIVQATDDTDAELAAGLEAALNAAGLDPALYSVRRHGTYVSIFKSDGTDIELADFSDDGVGGGTLATLEAPPNRYLMANNQANDSVSSRLFGDQGVVEWETFDAHGNPTQDRGTITISDAGLFEVEPGGVSFNINAGSLVAGNTLTVNTNSQGMVNPLTLQVSGTANSILDTYTFTVIQEQGGEIGADDIEIMWANSNSSGTFILEGEDPPITPVLAEVDGMKILFEGGTLFEDDMFTVTTDGNGAPTADLPSDWHWTLDSFSDQFNRQSYGVKSDVTRENRITFSQAEGGYKLAQPSYSGSEGFCEENITIEVNNYEAFTEAWPGLEIERDDALYASTGGWGVAGFTNPGYSVRLVAADGFDLDNGFHVELDGDRAFTVRFNESISGSGSIVMDITSAEGDYGFAFSDDQASDCGLSAALGVNTFFHGESATTIEVSAMLGKSRNYITAAKVDGSTGDFSVGDNTNALALADLQFVRLELSQWTFELGRDGTSSRVSATLSDYLSQLIGTLGIEAQSIERGGDFSEGMLNQISELRDSVSAVSLDEEMVSIMRYQHAFTVASKLLSVSDEMLETLVSMR